MPTLLAVIPHPDDESYSFGGTIALAAGSGWRCVVLCVSSGERGKRHDGTLAQPESMGRVRERELAGSCKLLGAELPRFLRLPDGGLSALPAQATKMRNLIDDLVPAVILALGPDGAYGHPDHIAVYRWVLEAWRSLPHPRPELLFAAFPRGLFVPQYEKCIGMMGDPPSPAVTDIGDDTFDLEVDIRVISTAKLQAIAAHRSQLPGGDPEAIFPPGIVSQLLDVERFVDARGPGHSSRLEELSD